MSGTHTTSDDIATTVAPAPSEPCRRDGCNGVIDGGWCTECGLAPPSRVSRRSAAPDPTKTSGDMVVDLREPVSTARTSRAAISPVAAQRAALRALPPLRPLGTTSRFRGSQHGLGAGLIDIPSVPRRDPTTQLIDDPVVPEAARFCAACDQPVGRSRPGRPGRVAGFCPVCRHRFDFEPKLAPGQIVAGQYEIAGCLARGGLGWIYLAVDRNVAERWVVLKGILDSGSPDARAAALAERQFLSEIEHPEIVKIYNYVAAGDAEYIVMEYVDGRSLSGLMRDRRAANGGSPSPLPLEHAIAFILGVLPAIDYLHRNGLVYCDFKPDNVIQVEDRLKLIDLGGARRLGDPSDVFGTVGYQAPEIASIGPSIASDIFTIVRTLAVLCLDFKGYTTTYRYAPPPAAAHPLLREFDSLRLLIERGTAADPSARFDSVGEVGDQLLAVLREVVAIRSGRPQPGTSTRFAFDLANLERGDVESVSVRQAPPSIADADDAAAPLLNSLPTHDPQRSVAIIRQRLAQRRVPLTVELGVRLARDLLALDDPTGATAALGDAAGGHEGDWRLQWQQGLIQLASDKALAARVDFAAVRSRLPGELAPQLALAMVDEVLGELDSARRRYERIAKVNPEVTPAVFGWSRVAAAMNRRGEAVAALGLIPTHAPLFSLAAELAVELLLADARHGRSDLFASAVSVVRRLPEDSSTRLHLERAVFESAIEAGVVDESSNTASLLGQPLDATSLRWAAHRVLRRLARREQDPDERTRLVDEAQHVRPWTLW